jgi:glycolate oxidase
MNMLTGSRLGLYERLVAIVGADHVRRDSAALEAYSRDATPLYRGAPEVICFPGNTSEVQGVVRLAAELGTPLVARGAGTNLSAATVPQAGGIVLVTTRMARLLELDTANMTAVVQPGLATAALADAAQDVGLLYPPDPGSRTTSTIGGNVATCAGGLRGLKYGVTRDYLLGCEAVLGTGEVIRTGGKAVKDVAGFDLARLLCGSEGVLAVLTEITLRLIPAPRSYRVGLAYFGRLAQAGAAVSDVLANGILPATLEFLDRTCLKTVEAYAHVGLRTDAGALLLFGQDGDHSTVDSDLEFIEQACLREGAVDVRIAADDEEVSRLLEARRAVLPSLSRLAPLTILEDATVPRSRLAEMVERIEAIASRHAVLIGTFGHAGDGNLHPTCVVDPAEEGVLTRVEAAFAEIFEAAIELGGTITGEHGVGLAKRPFLDAQLGDAQMSLLRRVKAAFDPAGILNPGKLGS